MKLFIACSRKGIQGQTILESLLCMLVICITFIGLLQIFNLSVAQLLTDYSSFYGARSYAVGFQDYLTQRSCRVAAIGASGKVVFPDNDEFGSPSEQFASEEVMIPEYIEGNRWLEYEYWFGQNEYDPLYYHPEAAPPSTYLGNSYTETGSGTVEMDTAFSSYPFPLFDLMDKDRVWFSTAGESTDITGEAAVLNYSQDYLE